MITLTLTTEEADTLHEALNLAHMERINQMARANDPRLAVLARVIDLIEAETVEGMIQRGEIEQGALAGPSVSIATHDAALASAALAYAVTMHTVGPGCATNPIDDENQQQAQHLQSALACDEDCWCDACLATDENQQQAQHMT